MGRLESELAKFAKSKRFIEATKSTRTQSAEWYASKMQKMIVDYLQKHNLEKYSNLSVTYDTKSDGQVLIGISFDNGKNLSPSLNPKRGPVILPRLLNTGFQTDSDVWGEWEGKRIHGLREREGLAFLQDVVAEFNKKYGKQAKAEYIQQDAY